MSCLKRRIGAVANGLRPRIALLAVVTALPLLALLLAGVVIDRREAIRAAETRAVDMARLAVEQQVMTVTDAANLLRAIARVPVVRNAQPGACHALLQKVADDDPRVDTIVVANENGDIVCNSEVSKNTVNVADRDYFRRARSAIGTNSFASGALVSRLTGKPIVVVAVPIDQSDHPLAGQPQAGGVIVATISLDRLFDLASYALQGTNHVACIINPEDGVVVATLPNRPDVVGKVFADHPLIHAFHAMPKGGSAVLPDLSGGARIFGFAPMHAGSATLVLGVGLLRSEVLAEANHRLYLGLALAIAATMIALGLAWYTARSALLRPIEALAGAASRFGAGDFSQRASTRGHVSEIRALGLAFNRMARRLQRRTQQLLTTQAALQMSEEHHRLLADNSTDMITRFGADFRRLYVSPSCFDLLGYRQEELIGQEPSGVVHPDDWLLLDATLNQPLRDGQPTARASYRAIRRDGSVVWLEASGRSLPCNAGFIVATRDITGRKMFERRLEDANRQLEALAMLDPLTGLANRRRFDELIAEEHRRSRRIECPVSLIMIDADRFKSYNDTYGHPAGDACLRAIAGAIQGTLQRPGDVAARYGGEEFAVLLPHTDAIGAVGIAWQIVEAVRLIRPQGDMAVRMTVSVGVAGTLPHLDLLSAPDMVAAADRALYLAKAAGGDAVRCEHTPPPDPVDRSDAIADRSEPGCV
jgi:diguanylate cyclase (GGDEF)-like protein/PAS domain S-box-containing protein